MDGPVRSGVAYVLVIANVLLALAGGSVIALLVGLAAAALALALGRRAGLSWDQLGLDRRRLRSGLVLGAAAAALLIVVAALVLALPPTRALLAAAAPTTVSSAVDTAFELGVRIPIGTALVEEVLFRSALLGTMQRRYSTVRAVWLSAVAFGAWHVLPALIPDGDNGAFGAVAGVVGTVPALAVIVAATTLAGVVFARLRLRSGHVVASVLAHAAINITAAATVLLAASIGR